MKKIIAILTALAVVSMAFAQTVSITNTLSTEPVVKIGAEDGVLGAKWGFGDENFLREQVEGKAETLDARATAWARVRFNAQTKDTEKDSLLNVKPQWHFGVEQMKAAALLKPVDFLEVFIGDRDASFNKGFGPSIAWENGNTTIGYTNKDVDGISIGHVTGAWQNVQNAESGLYVAYTGVDNLWIGGGFAAEKGGATWQNKSLIKKGVFGPFQIGATYNTDLFGVGAKYVGQFGGYNDRGAKKGNETGDLLNGKSNDYTAAKYNHHNIYAGFEFKGLQDAKVETKIGAAVDFDTHKASDVMNTKANPTDDGYYAVKEYTAFAVSANAGFDFRNGIGDTVAVTVAYQSIDGKKSKVLPFYIGNDLTYTMDNAKFSLHTSYMQGALNNAKKTYTDQTKVGDALFANYASLITLKPEFTFSMGAHSFNFGVETQVANQIKYNQKTSADWAFTSMYGKKAVVKFPMSWTYNF